MKRALLSGAAAYAMTAGSALAADVYVPPVFIPPPPPPMTVQAHVELYKGFATFDGDFVNDDTAFLFGGAGRANVPFNNGWNLQLDAQGSAYVFSQGKDSLFASPEFGGFGHAYYRDPNSHALGFFGGANFYDGPQAYTLGVEGQMYWPQFTLYGQAAVSSIRYGNDSATAFHLRGQGQWFITDDTVLLKDVMWTLVDAEGDTANILTLAGTAMHRFNGGPFSGFLRAEWNHITADPYAANEFSAVIGVRVSADPPGSTEMSHRRTGPAMDVQTLPFVDVGCFIGPC
jgi:hypothetical protein